jgi:GNAT superfamily N-acetyltransferase
MPMPSQHLPMSFAEWESLPYQPGWQDESGDGHAHITPNHQTAVTTATGAPRPVHAPWTIRHVLLEEETPWLAVSLEACADHPAFCDDTQAPCLAAARRALRHSFTGPRAPLLVAARVAVATEAMGAPPVGAAWLSRDREYGPVLDLLFSRPPWQHRGLATALVASAMNALPQAGAGTLTSCDQRANPASQAWHRVFGFVERPDLRYAQASHRRARQELCRREQTEDLTAGERAALHAEVQYWRQYHRSIYRSL